MTIWFEANSDKSGKYIITECLKAYVQVGCQMSVDPYECDVPKYRVKTIKKVISRDLNITKTLRELALNEKVELEGANIANRFNSSAARRIDIKDFLADVPRRHWSNFKVPFNT